MRLIRQIHDQTFFLKINEPLFSPLLCIDQLIFLILVGKSFFTMTFSGKSGLCSQWLPHVDLLLLVPGDDLPRAVLVVRHCLRHLHHGRHHLHPRLGPPRHTRPLEPSTHLVPKDVKGFLESYQRQTKAP